MNSNNVEQLEPENIHCNVGNSDGCELRSGALRRQFAPDAEVYTRLGIRPLINGVGVVTHLGGSLMPPEVVAAMEQASKHFVPLTELQRKVGEPVSRNSLALPRPW